jgi:hypothetical protein
MSIRFLFLLISQQELSYSARSLALRPTPNLEDKVSLVISTSNRVVHLLKLA